MAAVTQTTHNALSQEASTSSASVDMALDLNRELQYNKCCCKTSGQWRQVVILFLLSESELIVTVYGTGSGTVPEAVVMVTVC
jgi:hypothetical protein